MTDQEGATFPSFNIVEALFVDAMHLLDLGIGNFFCQGGWKTMGMNIL